MADTIKKNLNKVSKKPGSVNSQAREKADISGRNMPDQNVLRMRYDELFEKRTLAITELQARIKTSLRSMVSRPSVKTRVKDFPSFFKKYVSHFEKKTSRRSQKVTDIIGMRIICPFMEDLAVVEAILKKNFSVTETDHKGSGEENFREFGYQSIHLLVELPSDILAMTGPLDCDVAEIQIRTILQDAWAEVEHELIYKAEFTPFDEPIKRKLAAVNASLSLADIIFQEIRDYQRRLNGEFGKRRESFFRKIEESTDALLFHGEDGGHIEDRAELTRRLKVSNESMDELLLNALYAHNRNMFPEAIAIYTQILELGPGDAVRSLVFKHRGMAFFARSNYMEAIEDFKKSLEFDAKSYKSAYYEGIVFSVLKEYSNAVEAFNLSLKINPYQPYCLYRRGQAYYHLEDFPMALADCEAALAMEPFEGAKKFRELVIGKLNM